MKCPQCGSENPQGFAYCGVCGRRLPAHPAASRQATDERKVVTILFADLTDSTKLGEQRDPEQVRAIVGRFFDTMAEVIGRHGGTVEKFVGDEVMAIFGVPAAHEDDPVRAVHAALAMHARLADLNAELTRAHGVTLQMHVGINTGEVVANPQAAAKGEFMVTGDAVNVAARLRSAAAPGATLVGERTYRRTGWMAEYLPSEPLSLKGKSQPLAAWNLTGLRAEPLRRRGSTLRAPLVGRQQEFALLQGVLEGAIRDRRPRLATVVGAPGVGKSRLVEELIAAAPQATFLQGRSLPYGSTSLWALAEMVRSDSGILRSDPVQRMREKLDEHTRTLLGEEAARDQIRERLARVLGIEEDDAPPADDESRDDLFRAVRRYLEAAAAAAPRVLLFEDMHWADAELLDLIEYLAQRTADVPLVILATARPELLELRPAWGAGISNATSLVLQPLAERDASLLLQQLLGLPTIPQEVLGAIGVAEGNPFFLEEILHMLIDTGVLRRRNGGWESAGEMRPVVPDTVQGVVTARIDRLRPEEKAILLEASILGKDFWVGALSHLSGHAPDALDPLLHTLVTKDFLIEREQSRLEGQREFTFKHIIIRDAAYQMLPKVRRAQQHQAFGHWLDLSLQDRAEGFVELLAFHWQQAAGLWREIGRTEEWRAASGSALQYTLAAGRKAARVYANDQAAAHFQAARRIAADLGADAEGIAATEGLADIYALQARWDDASRLYQEALAYHERRGDAVRRARVQSRIASTFSGVFDFRRALPHLQAAVAKLQPQRDERELAGIYIQLARTLAAQGQLREAEGHVRAGVKVAEQHRLLPQLAEGNYVLGFIYTLLGRSEAADYYAQCVEIARQIDEPLWVILATQWNAFRLRWLGEYKTALDQYSEALDLARRTKNRSRLAFCLIGIAQTHFHAGDWTSASSTWKEYLAMAEEVPAWADHAQSRLAFLDGDLPSAIAWAQKFLSDAESRREVTSTVLAIDWAAHLYLRAGRADDARQLLQGRMEYLSQMGVYWPAFFHPVAVETMLALGDLDAAHSHLASAKTYGWMDNRWAAARLHRASALLHAATGAWEAGLESARTAVELYRAVGNLYELALMLEAFSGIARSREDAPDASLGLTALREAMVIYDRMGASFELRRLQESPR